MTSAQSSVSEEKTALGTAATTGQECSRGQEPHTARWPPCACHLGPTCDLALPDLLHLVADGGAHQQVDVAGRVQKDVLQDEEPHLRRAHALGTDSGEGQVGGGQEAGRRHHRLGRSRGDRKAGVETHANPSAPRARGAVWHAGTVTPRMAQLWAQGQ